MKIIGFQIVGIRKINLLEMELTDKGLIPIKGGNRQGKTTILDSLEMLFMGKKTIPADVVQKGRKRGRIEATLADGDDTYVITREIAKGGKTRLKITQNGKAFKDKPESFLKSLVNILTFDPRPFMDKSDKEKLSFMMELLNIDLSDLETEHAETYQGRRDIGRDIKSIGDLVPVPKTEKVDVQKILLEKERIKESNETCRKGIEESNQALRDEISKRQKHESTLESLKVERGRLEEVLRQAQSDLEVVKARIDNGERYLADQPDLEEPKEFIPESTEELDQKLANAAEINEKASAYAAYLERRKEKEELENTYDDMTEALERIKTRKQERLLKAPLPVEGLQIVIEDPDKEDGVYFNGIHSANWSEAESMRISSELCLGMQPELRALFIDRGEAYDPEGLKQLDTWARDKDLQAIITMVSPIPDVLEPGVFYIEEGELLSNP